METKTEWRMGAAMTDEERQKLCARLRTEGKGTYQAADEIERLAREREEIIKSSDAVCDSYAKENQRLSDKIERLAAENKKLKEQRSAWEQTTRAALEK